MKRDLGRVLGLVNRQIRSIEDFYDDPITRVSGCAEEFTPNLFRRAGTLIELILRANGYEYWDAFMDEVAARTSPRWLYQRSGLTFFDCEVLPFFDAGAYADAMAEVAS